jgi:hypothetical protein
MPCEVMRSSSQRQPCSGFPRSAPTASRPTPARGTASLALIWSLLGFSRFCRRMKYDGCNLEMPDATIFARRPPASTHGIHAGIFGARNRAEGLGATLQ